MKIANGSEDFEVLFLRNMHLTENVGHVHQLLTHDLKLPQILASKIISIVTWAQELGLIAACGAFLKLYNKGTIPFGDALEAFQKHESFIQQNTYFGNLVEELYVLRKHSESMIDVNKSKVVKTLDVTQLPKVEVNSNEPFDLMALI